MSAASAACQTQGRCCVPTPVAHSCAGVPGASFAGDCARLAALKALQGAQLSAASTRQAARLLRKRVGSPVASACGDLVASVLRGGLILLQCARRVAYSLFTPGGQYSLLKAVTARGAAAVLCALGLPWATARCVVRLTWGTAAGVYKLCAGAPLSDFAAQYCMRNRQPAVSAGPVLISVKRAAVPGSGRRQAACCCTGGPRAPAQQTDNDGGALMPGDQRRLRTAATRTTRDMESSSIAPTRPCTALVTCNAQAPRVVTWVACPRLALDAAPIDASRIIVFGLRHGERQPGESLEQRALLALPQPAAQPKQPLLLLPPPPPVPQPSSAPCDEPLFHAPDAQTSAEPTPASRPAGAALAAPDSMFIPAAPMVGESMRPSRRAMAFAGRPQPAQVPPRCVTRRLSTSCNDAQLHCTAHQL